jgi:actin-related protein 5
MRLLAQHSGNRGGDDAGGGGGGGGGNGAAGRKRDKGKDQDTFGMNDSDWDVYREMRVRESAGDDSDDDSVVDQRRLEAIRNEILDVFPDEDDPTLLRPTGSALLYVPHPHLDEIPIVVDRIRVPEFLFQPSLIGVEQCGLPEAVELCVSVFPSESSRRQMLGDVFLTGGPAVFPGFRERMCGELRARFPAQWGDEIVRGVRSASCFETDAWKGASLFARAGGRQFAVACISKQQYDENGPDYIREHSMSNWYVPTPYVDPVDAERKKKLLSYKRS